MYEAFYELRERPFSISPDPDFMFLGRQHAMALALLEYGLMNQAGFVVITGEAGTGKTTLMHYCLRRAPSDISVGIVSSTYRSCDELLQWILNAFQLEHRGLARVAMVQVFLDFLAKQKHQGKRIVLVIDEAQNLSPELLEELRVLSNANTDKTPVLHIVLLGQPGLRKMLAEPGLAHFAQRIAVEYHLEPLSYAETAEYIQHRMLKAGSNDLELFDTHARAAVHHHTRGIPRVINLLCDSALVYAFGEGRQRIDAQIIHEAAADRTTAFATHGADPHLVGVVPQAL
jgi:general secretion pathway protein A